MNRELSGAGCLLVALVIAVMLVTSGCASQQVPPVEIPVAVSCVDQVPVEPLLYTDAEILAMDDYRAIVALRSDRAKATLYIRELEDVVDVCDRAPDVVTVPR